MDHVHPDQKLWPSHFDVVDRDGVRTTYAREPGETFAEALERILGPGARFVDATSLHDARKCFVAIRNAGVSD